MYSVRYSTWTSMCPTTKPSEIIFKNKFSMAKQCIKLFMYLRLKNVSIRYRQKLGQRNWKIIVPFPLLLLVRNFTLLFFCQLLEFQLGMWFFFVVVQVHVICRVFRFITWLASKILGILNRKDEYKFLASFFEEKNQFFITSKEKMKRIVY